MPVLILRDRASFDHYCWLRKGQSLGPTVTGFYDQRERRTVTYREGFGPFDRLLHEGSHQLVHQYSDAAHPMKSFWFHEGLGGLFETFEESGDPSFRSIEAKPALNGPRFQIALRAINDESLRSYVSVRELMTLTVDSFQRWYDKIADPRERDRIADAYYAVSWGLAYFLMHSGRPAYREVLVDYFTLETRGMGGREAFERALQERAGVDLDQLQVEFKEFIRTLK